MTKKPPRASKCDLSIDLKTAKALAYRPTLLTRAGEGGFQRAD
jgi:hypothetical protein